MFYIWESAITLANQQTVALHSMNNWLPTKSKNNVSAPTVIDYWRLKIFVPFMDHLRTELEDRLCTSHPQLKGQYLLSNKFTQLTPVAREDIKTEYVPFID